ncbi:MAG: bacterial Ig-like domain-containing protein [Firmicutes bacterium]|nr:bacterial Ig-like domain-containing protein [Bacillota bacterium]
MKKRVISWLLTVVMVVSLLPTSVLADTLAADQEQQTQQEQIAPVDTENTVPAGNEETQEQQEPAPETPAPQMTRSGGAALALAEGTVSSAKEFAAMDASGSYTLTKDIIVTEPYAYDFIGTFDGNGHTVTLDITASTANVGLFSKLAGGAVVKNVKVDGTVSGTEGVAGIAAQANGATISGCINCAEISATERHVGGIVGKLRGGTVENCYNTGAISSSRTRPINMGGIAGYVDGGASVENCYNTGSITGSGDNTAAVVGWNAATVKNCYYLESTYKVGSCGNGDYTDPTVSKTDAEMRSGDIITLLGSAFMAKAGDYPALSWETPTAAVLFAIAPANATLEINGGTYTGSTTVALPAADTPYSYTVSCDGYTTKTGTVTVTNKDNPVADPANVTVTLAEDTSAWVNVTFNVTPTGAALTVKRGDTEIEPQSDGSYKLLKDHTYTYTAETAEEGYEPAAGEVTPDESSTQTVALKKVQSIAVTKAPTKTEYYKGDAELDLTGMVLTVKYEGTDETRTIEGDYAAAGVTYEGFSTEKPIESQTVTVKYRGKTATFTIKVKDAMLFADFFTGLNGIATAQNSTSYKFEPVLLDGGYVLKSTNEKKGNTTSSLTLTFAKAAQLTFDCKTDSEKNYDGLRVDINNQQGNQFGSTGGGYSGEKQEWKEFSIAVNAGDKVTVNYRKDSSGDKGQDCIWLRNFRAEVLPTVRFDVKDAAGTAIDATVTLKKGYTGLTAGTDGSYALTVGEKYTYTVEKKGYEKVTQEFTAQEGNNTITVTLVKLPVITLKFTPDDAAVTLKQGNTTVYKESADSEKGKNVYIAAKNTDYTYTVSKFGYETATGTISVATADVNKTVKLTELAKQTVTFNITKPEGVTAEPTITVTSGSITAYTGSGADCTLPAGNYTYTATLEGCDTLSGSFVVQAAKTISLEFVKSLTFDDFFADLDGITAENGTRYGFEPVRNAGGNYLESKKSYGTTTMKLTAGKPCVVSFQYFSNGYKDYWDEYGFTVKNGSKTLLTAYDESEWKTFSTVLKKGDELTLSFSGSDSYNVKLKDFTVSPVYTVSLNVTGAEDCTVVLQDASGAAITGTDGKYAVPAGVYTYTVSKYGYQTKVGKIIVTDKNVDQDVALTALTAYQVKFNVAPEGAAVTLTHPVGGKITADENGAYIVYAGETYAYTVAKADYITVSGSFTAAKNDTITVTLTYAGAGWDGTTKTAPKTENGVYQIGTAAELAWFADAVNGGQTTISGKLTANINLNGKTWTAIGTDSNKFAGTLDGDSHTVSGLAGTGGLVYYLSANGTVKSLCVDCAIDGTSNVGGIADKSEGRIENCLVSGYIKGGNDTIFGVGGIVGHGVAGNVISGCVSTADILFKYSRYAVQNGAGGIVGYTYGTVENCYFAGNVHTNAKSVSAGGFGGLVGCARSNAVMKDCYTVGAVTGPESSFGAVVGKVNSGAAITNCAYLDTVAPQAAADGTTSGMTARTADYMRTPEFAADVGMHLDSGNSNGGFPVLPWQGGTPVDNADLKAAADAASALQLRGMSAADAAKKAKADWYAETVLGLYELTDGNYNKADLCEKYGIEEPGEAVTDLHDYFLNALQKHFYKELGLDAENADLLKADATGVYQLRGLTPVSSDPEEEEETAQTYTGFLTLPASVTVPVEGSGEKTVSLTWTADNALVNTATGALTAPAADKVTVTLTATLQSGAATKVKTFTLCLWSEKAEKAQTLEDIAAEFTRKNTAVQPLEGVGLYDETNITQAFRRLLAEQGYADVADKAEITYVNGSAKANGFDDTKVKYIADNGNITYFTGDGTARQTVQYTGLKFNITYAGVTKEITLRATVGRSADAVQKLLESAAGSLNWELIRGENTNGATQSEVAGWTLYTVNDRITSNLTLPSGIAGRYDVKVQWGTRNTEWLYITNGTNGTGVGTVNRPLQPADGTPLPEKAGKFRLIARVTYDAFDDYTLAHITGDNGVEVYADVFFDATVAPFDSSVTSEMQNALAEKYQGLLRDFVDKTKPVDLTAVSDDMQMPRPALLEEKGIMSDSYNQKVTMVSLTPDVLDFYGYHARVYRPLPGEKPVEAKYVVTITTRSSGLLLARQEFSFTIQPFTPQELDGAAAFMTEALTEAVYWNGISNGNTDKDNITGDLKPFVEIHKEQDGTLTYVYGAVNMDFSGIKADDIPGWYASEKYRTFYSSRPTVIEHELLRVHPAEYNAKVTVNSVLSYSKYAQYWEKFGINGTEESKERYKDFAQFYKQPIHIDLTVIGEKNAADPNENQTLTVKVKVDGYDKNGHTFTGISGFTFTGKANEDPTAWDAVKACLDSAKYTYTGSGAYIKSITDAAGHTLKEKGDGKSSGWMFGIAVKGGNETLPKTTLDNTYLKDGDTLRLFFTDTYIPLDPTDPAVPGAEVPGFDEAYAGAKAYIQSAVSAPVVSYLFGEWAVLGQARAKVPLSEAYIAAYYEKVVAYVKANIGSDGILRKPDDKNTPVITDNERIILALTAIGKDPANVGGKNLLTALQDKDIMKVTDTSKTDINGLVMGLLALNSRNYTSDTSWLVQAVLEQQNKDGSWSASADTKPVGDVDMTAMALQALAPYYKDGGNETVNTAVKKALNWLSGKYRSGYDSSESCAQVVIALSALNLDANTDARFTKTVEGKTLSVLGNLLQYRVAENGGFKHQFADKAVNEMATEQALCAMAAYARFTEKANALYDMTDAACAHRFGEWKVTVAATCTKDGVSRRICSICGVVEEKPVPATGHKFSAWTVTKAATCTESGISTCKCSVCGTEETMIVPSLGHSMTATAGKAATCTEAGNSAYWTCSRCHKFFSDAAGKTEIAKDSWVIAALGHDEATRAAVAATCYASGHEADTYCKRCGIVITAGATIPATGKHTYVNGVCTVCGVKNPMANVKGDDIKVDSKDNKTAAGDGLVIKADDTITGEVLADIKAAVSDGAITVTVTDTLQLTNEQKAADGGKSALTEAAKTAGDEVKKELNKLAEKLDALRGDKSRKNAQLEKVVDVTVALVKTEGNEIKTVAQLIELPHSVTVTIPITDELYAALQGKHVCVVRSHTDSSGNVTTAELSATLGGTKGNYVLTFQTDKASAFAIVSYETVSSGYYYGGSGTADSGKTDSSNTADDSQMVLWLGSAVLAAAAVVVLTRKKRVSK